MVCVGPLLTKLRARLDPLEEILEAYVFGSTATGLAQDHSDIDVAVYLGDRPPAAAFGYGADLAAALMRELGTNAVTTTGEGQALSRYCDFLPQLAKIQAAHRAR
jgi:predicted nucleotidyltransferase